MESSSSGCSPGRRSAAAGEAVIWLLGRHSFNLPVLAEHPGLDESVVGGKGNGLPALNKTISSLACDG
ncbi:hypothetical protein GFC01_15890 [Desulfofundulus thermobenzoicus]|uniref:Uncharacterized protein n=1 Tax=Desulfofundulus thermobenzoicus TaxID=29376 RepID=A0A6N7IVU7_9FIRM|nr:hypothetical protein [Desulfofundulus thermobenzoicus]MQL53713.1 hypothetical protein [Desulfofundulus thermobenzoicus]